MKGRGCSILCIVQSNPLKWIALGPDCEYPFDRISTYPCFILYIVSKRDQTKERSCFRGHLLTHCKVLGMSGIASTQSVFSTLFSW